MAASGRLDGDLEGRLACIALLLSYKANLELPDKVLLLNPFICPSTHLSIHSCMHACIQLFVHPFVHSFMLACFRSFIHSVSQSLIHSFTRSLIHSFTRSLIHSCIHPVKSLPQSQVCKVLNSSSVITVPMWVHSGCTLPCICTNAHGEPS